MTLKTLGFAVAAGLSAALVVGAAVTELLSAWIEFSLFVGIPAGLLAGVAVAVVVSLGLGENAPATRRRLARSVGAFGVGFLVTLLVAVGLVNVGTVLSLALAGGVGVLVALVAYRRTPRKPASVQFEVLP